MTAYIKAAVIGAVFLVLLALIATGGWLGYQHGSMTVQAKWDASVKAQKDGEDAALKAAAEAIAKIEVKSEKHIQPIRTEIRTNTVYRDCVHSPDSLRHLNSLITGIETQSTGSGFLPGPVPAP